MISAYKNCVRIPELRKRLLISFGIIALCRLASLIPCRSILLLKSLFGSNRRRRRDGFADLFSGGALSSLQWRIGIMPTFRVHHYAVDDSVLPP